MIERDVPCNGCTACCKHDHVYLKPGDNPQDYLVEPGFNDSIGELGLRLRHKSKRDGGGCIYLGPTGCTIHGRAPIVCKEFDCRRTLALLNTLPRPIRRRIKRMYDGPGIMGSEVMTAAKARLHTLDLSTLEHEIAAPDDSPLSRYVNEHIL
jgi:putative zinc- or iron-chelating protein